jgi:hypothetical protein
MPPPFVKEGRGGFSEIEKIQCKLKHHIRPDSRRDVVHHHAPAAGQPVLAPACRRGFQDVEEPEKEKGQHDPTDRWAHQCKRPEEADDLVDDDPGGIFPIEDPLRFTRCVDGKKGEDRHRYEVEGPG